MFDLIVDFIYVCFYCGVCGRCGNYLVVEFEVWCWWIVVWCVCCEVYVYVNNDWEGFLVKNVSWFWDYLIC